MSAAAAAADRQELAELARMERYWRDTGHWAELAECYTENSRIRTTWFEGTGAEFAEASRDMAENRNRLSRHLITPTRFELCGRRALIDSYAEIHNRDELDGVEVDMLMYCRFFSLARKTQAGWKLASFDGIYAKDLIWPVNPAASLPFEWSELERFRPSYRVWAYTLSLKGYDIGQEELGEDRPEQLKGFIVEATRWLEDED
jgi:hypothetical protein